MQPQFLSGRPDEMAVSLFAAISLVYLLTLWLYVRSGTPGHKLTGAGLLTAVAAIGYGSLVFPAGPLYAPYLLRLAFVLVLAGIGLRILDRIALVEAPQPPEEPHG